jgi:hypothetical protein
VIQEKATTCFSLHEEHGVCCKKDSCHNWVNYREGKNCVLITAKSGPKTLQEIGKIYGLTRMRICQIEKSIYKKIRNIIQDS